MKFGKQEVKNVIITSFAASSLLIIKNLMLNQPWLDDFVIYLLISCISLFFKLYIHKRTAKRFDCDAIYEFNYNLFLLAIMLSFLTQGLLPFLALGSVSITSAYISRLGHKFTNITLRERGLIALSGSMGNIILALIGLTLYPISNNIFQSLINVNILMALFNLMPFPPLDGSKVIWWNRLVWLMSFLIALFLFLAGETVLFSLIGILLLVIITFVLWEKMF